MLIREYKLLRSLSKSTSDCNEQFLVYLDDSAIESPSGNMINCAKGQTDMMSNLRALAENGYISFSNDNEYIFILTNKGAHFLETFFSECLRIIVTSVMLPIIVSVITTLVTLWLKT